MSLRSYIANGTISPSRFVTLDTTLEGRVDQATGTSTAIIGISQEDTRRSPYIDSNNNAALVNEPIGVYDTPGEICGLKLGGTVTVGARLTSDGSGQGVSTTTDQAEYAAIALVSGVSGDVIAVQVFPYARMS